MRETEKMKNRANTVEQILAEKKKQMRKKCIITKKKLWKLYLLNLQILVALNC